MLLFSLNDLIQFSHLSTLDFNQLHQDLYVPLSPLVEVIELEGPAPPADPNLIWSTPI